VAINDTSVDAYNLPGEIFGISSAIDRAGEDVKDAMALLDEKEKYYKYLKSKKWKQYRTKEIEIEGIKSPSATDVNSIIDSDEELYELQKEISQLQKDVNTHKSYLTALDVKKRSLEQIIKIVSMQWYNDVRVSSTEDIQSFLDESGNIVDPLADRKAYRRHRERERMQEEDEGEIL